MASFTGSTCSPARTAPEAPAVSAPVPRSDPPPHPRCLTCTRADNDRKDAAEEGDLRRRGECNRVINDHPHIGRPVDLW
ncbi:hypothetical protein [Streptomyces yunnanensis]|uniref:Uncharacterized protein n=1 Tax=Streptomyces yunnanensis TaxID=156453 RepID=A0A9X8N7R8_9ACTN|nr:hypothetical protein [Streptomyces yunnanensis]SHN24037.1 hypothetical protein SAMN05216268_12659 [Streptomyces yunnanensis]